MIIHTEHKCENLLLEVQPRQRFLRSTWSGIFVGERYRALLQRVMHAVERDALRYWLTDARQAGPISKEDQAWTMREFTPQVMKAGIERIAIVGSEDPLNAQAVERFVSATPDEAPYAVRFFPDPSIAMLWLLERKPMRDTAGEAAARSTGGQA
ncbi:MAG: STAS/SEC14 domain-containing protein [Flavobacteriales bacterium]|jgi:hypothetical protein|nr:STAS/SEC14 domain-containing protein [Flavobacteriales bacterium]